MRWRKYTPARDFVLRLISCVSLVKPVSIHCVCFSIFKSGKTVCFSALNIKISEITYMKVLHKKALEIQGICSLYSKIFQSKMPGLC